MPTLPSPEEASIKLKEKIKELETSIEKYVENAEAYNRDWDDDGLPEVDKKTLDEMIARLERLKRLERSKKIRGGTRRRKRKRKRKTRKRKRKKSRKKQKRRRRRTRK